MATQDLPDIYTHALGHIYQANPLWPWYNYLDPLSAQVVIKYKHGVAWNVYCLS